MTTTEKDKRERIRSAGWEGEGFKPNSMDKVGPTEETPEPRPERGRGEGGSPVLISRTSGGKSCTKTLRQELVWQVLVVDRGRLGKVGRDRSTQGPDHAGPYRPW